MEDFEKLAKKWRNHVARMRLKLKFFCWHDRQIQEARLYGFEKCAHELEKLIKNKGK